MALSSYDKMVDQVGGNLAYSTGMQQAALRGSEDVKPSTPLDTAHRTFIAASELSYRVSTLTSALLGPIPVPVSEGGPKNSGILWSLELAAEETARAIVEANEALSRLERTLGI